VVLCNVAVCNVVGVVCSVVVCNETVCNVGAVCMGTVCKGAVCKGAVCNVAVCSGAVWGCSRVVCGCKGMDGKICEAVSGLACGKIGLEIDMGEERGVVVMGIPVV
jgi:hypothetical protein